MQASLTRFFLRSTATAVQLKGKPRILSAGTADDTVLTGKAGAREIVAKLQPDMPAPKSMGSLMARAVRMAHDIEYRPHLAPPMSADE